MKASTSSRRTTLVASTLTGLYVFALIGFYARSPDPTGLLGMYSLKYAIGLLGLTILTPYVFIASRFLFSTRTYALPSGREITFRPRTNFKAIASIAVVLVVFTESYYLIFIGPKRQPDVRAFHPTLQVQAVPDGDHLNLNRWGFRGEDIERAKTNGTYRIFVLGGSTVMSDRVEFEQSHVRILENGLRARYPGRRIEVQNAGMHWHTSQESLIKYATKVRDFDPDLIIVWHAFNDMCRSFRTDELTTGEYQPDYSHFIAPVHRMYVAYLESTGTQLRLGFMSEVYDRLSSFWFSRLRGPPEVVPPEEFRLDEWKSLPAFDRNMDALVTLVAGQGVSIALASQASLYRTDLEDEELATLEFRDWLMKADDRVPDLPSIVEGMNLYNDAARDIAARHSVPFLDLAARVPKDLDHFLDGVHYTAAGNRVVGEAVLDFVIRQGFIDR